MTRDEKFVQWLKIAIAAAAFVIFVDFANMVLLLLTVIANK